VPEVGTVGSGWGVRGTVTLVNGRTKTLIAGVSGTKEDSAYVGSKGCGEGSSYSAATNTIVLTIDFTPCVDGRAVVRLYAIGQVSGSKAAGEDTYFQQVYVDTTASKNLRLS